MIKNISTKTKNAFSEQLMNELSSLKFCIVGCGGTGATFAEMLVRSGAKNICLVDGDKVCLSNLNRVFGFVHKDSGEYKVKALKDRLESINTGINICSIPDNFRKSENITDDNTNGQKVRDSVYSADVVFIGVDKNEIRIECEELCKQEPKKMYLSTGIIVDKEFAYFECNWKPETPEHKKEDEGYGPENSSFISIVSEATSVAFTMLLHHIDNPKSREFKSYYKKYSGFKPITIQIDGKCIMQNTNCNKL